MAYKIVASGQVESCRKRSNGYIIGVRTKLYLVEHYLNASGFKIGETVEIRSHPDFGVTLVAAPPAAVEGGDA